MAGLRVIPSVHRHHQEVISTSWVITHNFGGSGSQGVPIVDVMVLDPDDGVTLKKIMPQSVTIIDANTVAVVFSSAFAGYAVVVG